MAKIKQEKQDLEDGVSTLYYGLEEHDFNITGLNATIGELIKHYPETLNLLLIDKIESYVPIYFADSEIAEKILEIFKIYTKKDKNGKYINKNWQNVANLLSLTELEMQMLLGICCHYGMMTTDNGAPRLARCNDLTESFLNPEVDELFIKEYTKANIELKR